MTMTVTVALLGDPTRPLGDMLTEESLALRYSERSTVELAVEDAETLGQVLTRAAELFDLPSQLAETYGGLPSDFVSFYTSRDNSSFQSGITTEVVLVADEGYATWGHYYRDVIYRDLLRSAEAGALGGDPKRPYLVLQPGIGNGVIADWEQLLQAWEVAYPILKDLGATYGGLQAVARASRAAAKGIDVLRKYHRRWQDRNASPDHMAEFLKRPAWSTQGLATLLACSPDEAEHLLTLHGYSYDGTTKVWSQRGEQVAEFLRGHQEIILAEAAVVDDDLLRRRLEQRSKEFAETGVAPPVLFDWEYEQALPTTSLPTLKKYGLRGFYQGLRQRLARLRRRRAG